MNWKTLTETWEAFYKAHDITIVKNDRHYFHGKQTVNEAKENFHGYSIYYKITHNKSAASGASFGVGNSIKIIVPVELIPPFELHIKKSSFWKRWTSERQSIQVKTQGTFNNEQIPIQLFEELITHIPDLKLSIKPFNKRQFPQVHFGQTVLLLESKQLPSTPKELELSRTIVTTFLKVLKDNNRIKAYTN